MPSRRSPKRDSVEDHKDLGNQLRNEQQKSMLLCEVGKIRRDEMEAILERSRRILEESKRLCAPQEPRTGK